MRWLLMLLVLCCLGASPLVGFAEAAKPDVAALRELLRSDRTAGVEQCVELMRSGEVVRRPVGAALLAETGDFASLTEGLDGLTQRESDCRRWLVKAMGSCEAVSEERSTAIEARLVSLLTDRDVQVRIAAVAALAERGNPHVVGRFVDRMPARPGAYGNWWTDPAFLWSAQTHGAFHELTGARLSSPGQIQRWWREHGEGYDGARRVEVGGAAMHHEGMTERDIHVRRGYVGTRHFDVHFHHEADIRQTLDRGYDWLTFGRRLEQTLWEARQAVGPVLGHVPLPVIELHIADAEAFDEHGGARDSEGGVAKSLRIVMHRANWTKLHRLVGWRALLRHELVHTQHYASFVRQPRWLAEGLAESVTRSRTAPAWDAQGVTMRELDDEVRRGVFRGILRWRTYRSDRSMEQERERYMLSHLAMDYLRFGGHSAAEARLAFLMGRISRGESDAAALRSVYGQSVSEMDAGLRGWLAAKSRGDDGKPEDGV